MGYLENFSINNLQFLVIILSISNWLKILATIFKQI